MYAPPHEQTHLDFAAQQRTDNRFVGAGPGGSTRRSARHFRAQDRKHPRRPELGVDGQRRRSRRARNRWPGRASPRRAHPEPQRGVVVRSRLPALLHPRLRQRRLPPECVATRLADLRRCRAGKPDPQGLSDFRSGADRSAARPPRDLVRPQHARRRGEVRLGQTCA
jgi:hypothetical protein